MEAVRLIEYCLYSITTNYRPFNLTCDILDIAMHSLRRLTLRRCAIIDKQKSIHCSSSSESIIKKVHSEQP